jgi:hypothetical protein
MWHMQFDLDSQKFCGDLSGSGYDPSVNQGATLRRDRKRLTLGSL